jgi:hypothetical protein
VGQQRLSWGLLLALFELDGHYYAISRESVLTRTRRRRSVLVDLEKRARGMVRHVVRRGFERSEPMMFWEADDQEICVLTLGCSKDPGHFSSVDQNCVRVNVGHCRSL